MILHDSRHVPILGTGVLVLVLRTRARGEAQAVSQEVQSSCPELGVADRVHQDEYHDQGEDNESNDQTEGIGFPEEASG